MMGSKDARNVTVAALIVASYKGEKPVKLMPAITMGKKHSPLQRVRLPGPQDAYLTLVGIDATSKTIGLAYHGPPSPSQESAQTSPPAVIAEVSIKPGMTLLWLGTLLILAGGGIAMVRHWPK